MSKRYTTNFLVDTNGNTGASGQVLLSTSTGVNWSDGSDILGGPFLPLSAGSSFPLTGDLTINKVYPKLLLNDTQGVARNFSVGTNNETFTVRNETASSDAFTIYNDNDATFIGAVGIGVAGGSNAKLEVAATSGEVFRADSNNGAYRLVVDQTGVNIQGVLDVAGTINSGAITSTGTILADTFFGSTDTNVVLGTTGSGNVYLRPNGYAAGANQTIINATGDMSILGGLTLEDKATSAATIASDGVTTLTTKSYVDGLVTGVPVYKGTWAAGTTGVTSAAIAGTVITLTAAPTNTIAVGDIVTATGIVGLTTLVTVVTSQTSITVGTAVAIAITETVTFSPAGGFPDLTVAATQVLGNYYIVDTTGYATPNGASVEPDSWNVGDWAIFSDITPGSGTDLWQKIDNTSVISGAGTGQKIAKWEGALNANSETLTDSIMTEGNGSIGINNPSPSSTYKLDVGGSIRSNTSAPAFVLLESDASNQQYAMFGLGGNFYVRDITGGTYPFKIESAVPNDTLVLDSTGNVGIGIAAPTFKLHVNSTDASDDVAYIHHNNAAQSSGDVLKVRSDAGDNEGSALLNVVNNTGSALYVRGDRKIGIGTDAPGNKLQVVDATDISASNTGAGQFAVEGNGYTAALALNDTRAHLYHNSSSRDFSFGTNESIDVTIKGSNGHVGIGTTTPDALLEISGNAGADPGPITNPTTFRITDAGNAATGAGDIVNPWGKIEFYSEDVSSTGPSVQAQIASVYNTVYSNSSDLNFYTRTSPASTLLSRMTIEGGGNVGIGTNFPNQSNLVVSPSAQSADVDGITLTYNPDGATNRVRAQLKIGSFAGILELTNSSDTISTYITAAGDSFFTGGDVGVGTDSPTTTLSVKGTSGNGINIIGVGTTATRCFLGLNSANKGYLFIAGSSGENPAVITSQGDSYISTNLGIGNTVPSEKLDVDGDVRVRNLTAGIVTSSATGVLSTGGPTPMNMSLGEGYAANIREKYYRTNRTVYPSTIGSQFAQLIQQDLLNSMSLIMSPVATQTSEVSSVRPENNSGDFSFTRATKASRVASSGYIVRQTENYIRYSNEFNNSSYWTLGDATVTWGQADYFGKSTAWKLQDTASTAQHFVRQTTGVGGVVTVSVYAKAGTKSFLYIRGVEGTTSKETFFNLSAGAVGTVEGITASMEAIGSGWYRCSASFDHNPPYEYYFGVADADNVTSYTGDGTGNIYIVNTQIESGIGVREYNATTSSMFYGGETYNVPRIDYKNGVPELLLEKRSTNVVYCSAKMVGLGNVTQSFSLSPEGILNGIKINEIANTGQHYGAVRGSVVSGTQYFLSFYIKKGASSNVTIYTQSSFISSSATVDLDNGTISTNSTDSFIEDVGGGWYRAGYKTSAATQTGTSMNIYLPVTSLNSYAGDVDNYTEYYGIQLETAPIVTSHIPTYNGAVTRNNEIIALSQMSTNTIAANATAATLMVEFSNNYTNAGDTLQWHSSPNIIGRGYFYVRQIGFADTWGASGLSTTDGVNTKVIWRLNSLTSGSFFKDGVKSSNTVTGDAWPDINKLIIRSDFGTMRIRNIFMASTDLTDDQCIKLTTINE